jgi:lipopolysaccharide export system permease protein
MFSIVDRYIARAVFASTAFVFAVFVGLFSVVLFLDAVKDLGRGHFNGFTLIAYVLLSLPGRIYEVFPAATLVGTITGLSMLALNSELTALRAGGASLARIVFAVLKAGAVLIVIGVFIGELVMPGTTDLAERGRAEALGNTVRQQAYGVWLRDANEYIRIGEVLPDLSVLKLEIYQFDGLGRLRGQIVAERARYREDHWRLEGVAMTGIGDNSIGAARMESYAWRPGFTADLLSAFTIRPNVMPVWRLYQYISHLRRNQQETAQYELAFWKKVVLPISAAVMILLAIPFVFGQIRSGGIGQRVFVGVMLGMVYSLFDIGLGQFGLVYGITPFLSAILPAMLFLVLAIVLLRRVV